MLLLAVAGLGCAGPRGTNDAATVDARRADGLAQTEAQEQVAREDTPPDVLVDCAPGQAGFGCLCSASSDCGSGWCVFHLGERVCSTTCLSACPDGWSCEETASGVDTIFICESLYPSLCLPCKEASDCPGPGDECLDYGESSGSFCGGSCGDDQPCPPGYGCVKAGAGQGEQCMLSAGECSCTAYAAESGAGTFCHRSNEWGTCQGWRSCSDVGLAACAALDPVPETCDGKDNDCDEIVDEETDCDDDDPCTEDSCEGGECTVQPLTGNSCEDADLCTQKEHCQDGLCVGEAVPCDDENQCTDDSCEPEIGCVFSDNESPCSDDGDPCTSDLCSAGECIHFPGNDGATCQDGDECTADDACLDGLCIGGPLTTECQGNCGDGACTGVETGESCAVDCGPCGDGVCGFHENGPGGGNCPQDCLAACGDGECAGGETAEFCLLDCGGCGDGLCSLDETSEECLGDCPPECGDDLCEPGENGDTCPADCMSPCGDGLCGWGENPYGCPQDCSYCGDGICSASEDDLSCAQDCASACGNSLCESAESPESCPVDCGSCGDGTCGFGESGESCVSDCQEGCGNGLCQAAIGEGASTCPADCILDADNDGFDDWTDNCPAIYNPQQDDTNADGEGDICDQDDDGDGEGDASDCAPLDDEVNHQHDEICDAKDNDCDEDIDEEMGSVTCGLGACEVTQESCVEGVPQECVPTAGAPELCDGEDNNCDGLVDEPWPDLGLSCQVGAGLCLAEGTNVCDGTTMVCDAVPGETQDEVCDGLDNDCDDAVDEELDGQNCTIENEYGTCVGAFSCVDAAGECIGQVPSEEICDGADNNCDGTTDESFLDTDNDLLADCVDDDDDGDGDPDGTDCAILDPHVGHGLDELCDDKDNNCNDESDELWPELGEPCSVGIGECENEGTTICLGPVETGCSAQEGQGSAELCDDLDNDCDGNVDEDWPELGSPCISGKGECAAEGTYVCSAGQMVCDGVAGQGEAETCDGLDNDCDGEIDNGLNGQPCPIQNEFGTCTGASKCANSMVTCVGFPAQEEVCDAFDNDCDGEVDEDDDVLCDDELPCTADSCNADFGFCEHIAYLANGEPCNADSDGCTAADSCLGGACVPGGAADCSGVTDQCVGANCISTGPDTYDCQTYNIPEETPCDDGDACTEPDICVDGLCSAWGLETYCNDDSICTIDDCDFAVGCTYQAFNEGAPCGDGLENHTCQNGECLCNASCLGKECDDDGCGGSCGTCSVGEQCELSLCRSASVVWANRYADSGQGTIVGLAREYGSSDFCVAGIFDSDTFSFGGEVVSHFGGDDIFVAYLEAQGTYIWSDSFGSVSDDRLSAVQPYSHGCGLAGELVAQIDFGGGNLGHSGGGDAFVAMLDDLETLESAGSFGGVEREIADCFSTADSDFLHLAGRFFGSSITLGNDVLTNTSAGTSDIFVMFTETASLYPEIDFSIGGDGNDEAVSITVDHYGTRLLAGHFDGLSIDLGQGGLANSDPGTRDIFLARYDDGSATLIWGATYGSTGSETINPIGYSEAGSIILTGEFVAPSIVFGDYTLQNSDTGTTDIYVAKIKVIDGTVEWAGSFGSAGDDDISAGVPGGSNQLLLAGTMGPGSIDLGGGLLETYGGRDGWLSELDPGGTHVWSRSFGGIGDEDLVTMVIASNYELLMAGSSTSGSMALDGEQTLENAGGVGLYLVLWDPD